jgi:hypothetical protein
MESRGIYMSTDRGMVKQYAEALLKRNRELAIATLELQVTVRGSQVGEFPTFKERILQDSPGKGLRTIAVRRLQIGGPDDESHLFVSMFEDQTDVGSVALPPTLVQKSRAA